MAEKQQKKGFGDYAAETVSGIFNILTPSNTIGAVINQIQGDSKNGFVGDVWKGNKGIGELNDDQELGITEELANGIVNILAPVPNAGAKLLAIKTSAKVAKALGKTLPLASIAKGIAQGVGVYEAIDAGAKAAGVDNKTAEKIATAGSLVLSPFVRGTSDQLARKVFRNASNRATPYLNKLFDSRASVTSKQGIFNGMLENAVGGNLLDAGLVLGTGNTLGGIIGEKIGINPFVADMITGGVHAKIGGRAIRRLGNFIYADSRGASDPLIGQLQLLNGQSAIKNIDEKQAFNLSRMFSPATLNYLRKGNEQFKKLFGKDLRLNELVEDFEDTFTERPDAINKITKEDYKFPVVGPIQRGVSNIPYYVYKILNPKTYFKKIDILKKAQDEIEKKISKAEQRIYACQKIGNFKAAEDVYKQLEKSGIVELAEKLDQMKEAIEIAKDFSRSYTELTGERLTNLSGESSLARRFINGTKYMYSPFRTPDSNRTGIAKKLEDFFIKYGGGYNSTILSPFRQSVKALNYGKRALKTSAIDETYLRKPVGNDTGSFFWGKKKHLNLFEQMANVIINPKQFDSLFEKFGWQSRIRTGREVRVKSNIPDMVGDILQNGQLILRNGELRNISANGQLNIEDILKACKYNERAQTGKDAKDFGYKFKHVSGAEERLVQDTQLGHNSPLGLARGKNGETQLVTNDINGHIDLDVVYNGKRYTLTVDVGGIGSGGGGDKGQSGFFKYLRGSADDAADFTIVNIDVTGGRERFERQFYNGHVKQAIKRFEEGIAKQKESIPEIEAKIQTLTQQIDDIQQNIYNIKDPTHEVLAERYNTKRFTSLLKSLRDKQKLLKDTKSAIEHNEKELADLIGRDNTHMQYDLDDYAHEIMDPHLFKKDKKGELIRDERGELVERNTSLSNKNMLPISQLKYFDDDMLSNDAYTKRRIQKIKTDSYKENVTKIFGEKGHIHEKLHATKTINGALKQIILSEEQKLKGIQGEIKNASDKEVLKKLNKRKTQSERNLTLFKILLKRTNENLELLQNNQDVILSQPELMLLSKINFNEITNRLSKGGKLEQIQEFKQGGLINNLNKPKTWEEYQKRNRK